MEAIVDVNTAQIRYGDTENLMFQRDTLALLFHPSFFLLSQFRSDI